MFIILQVATISICLSIFLPINFNILFFVLTSKSPVQQKQNPPYLKFIKSRKTLIAPPHLMFHHTLLVVDFKIMNFLLNMGMKYLISRLNAHLA